eukprot:8978631-Pyramimonas_sp.AAC.1
MQDPTDFGHSLVQGAQPSSVYAAIGLLLAAALLITALGGRSKKLKDEGADSDDVENPKEQLLRSAMANVESMTLASSRIKSSSKSSMA